jgi:hypothetical protein
MIDSKKMKQIVAHIVKRDKGIQDKEHMYPMREWLGGILATFVVVVAGGILSCWYYNNVTTVKSDVTVPTASVVPYDGTRIGLAIAKYEARSTAFDRLRGEESVVVETQPVSAEVATTTPEIPTVEEPEPPVEEEVIGEEVEVGAPLLGE